MPFFIRTVNLVWQKKQRGAYPPSVYSLDDLGALALAMPRPLEARAYDFAIHRPDGAIETKWSFSAETLMKMELSHSENAAGMTSDDLYLFRNHLKSRFLGDKHINFIDIALSADGNRVAAGFSDLAGASFAIAYGDIGGKQIWLEEFDSPLTAVAISRDGLRVAAGDENGRLSILDEARRNLFSFDFEVPIRALACSEVGAAYALAGGEVGLIGGGGARIWQAAVEGEASSLAITADGGLCAALADPIDVHGGSSALYLFMQDGSVGWHHDTERRSTRVAVSASGEFAAVGARDGSIMLFGVVSGEATDVSFVDSNSVVNRARCLEEAGKRAEAAQLLKQEVAANPIDITLAQEYVRMRSSWRNSGLASAREAISSANARDAIRICAELLEDDPLCFESAVELKKAREARAGELVATAQKLLTERDDAGAESALREAVAVAPLDLDGPRLALADCLKQRAESLDIEADSLVSAEDNDEAVSRLISAQSVLPNPERAKRIHSLQIEVELDAGMRAYKEKKYVQAVFQFKKVLRLEPGNSEAIRYLEFAKRFSSDTSTTDSLQDRFSRLE